MSSKPLLPGSEPEPGPTSSWLASAIKHQWVIWTSAPILLGIVLGLALPSASTLPSPLDSVSHVIGWTYFTAWSISFYPQIWLNYSRKSVSGLSLDFQLLNLLGFASYAIYNAFLYWSPLIRLQYQRAHDGYLPAVHMNDVFFAIHAAVLTAVTLLQSLLYPQDRHPPHRLTLAGVGTALLGMLGYAAFLALAPHIDPSCTNECPPNAWFTWLNLLYVFSLVKLAISLVKYVPQVVLNHRLKSTRGWNVWNVLLDFEGGLLSLVQMLIDNSVCGDWSAITGNPVKFALGFVSMFFDVIFVGQHVVFRADREGEGDLDPWEESGPSTVHEYAPILQAEEAGKESGDSSSSAV